MESELTATAVRVMTPEYASPEQIKGERITTSSDVYSLGVLLYELLTGLRPYRVKSRQPEEIAKAICEQQPDRPSTAVRMTAHRVPTSVGSLDAEKSPTKVGTLNARHRKLLHGDLDNIVLMALRKEPARRYQSVTEFSEDIRRHLEGLPISARKTTFGYRTSKFVRRNKIGVSAAALILLTLAGGIIATTVEARRANRRFNEVRQLAHTVLFDYHDAIAALPGSIAVRQRLVKDALQYLDNLSKDAGNDVSLMRELANAYERVAAVQGGVAMSSRGTLLSPSNLGDMPGALQNLNKALEIFAGLVVNDTSNGDFRRQWAYTYLALSRFQFKANDFNNAVDSAQQGIKIDEVLVAASPTNASERNTLAFLYRQLGDARAALGAKGSKQQWNAAKEAYQKALDIYQDMKNKGKLSGADAGKPDELTKEIAKCDAALEKSR